MTATSLYFINFRGGMTSVGMAVTADIRSEKQQANKSPDTNVFIYRTYQNHIIRKASIEKAKNILK